MVGGHIFKMFQKMNQLQSYRAGGESFFFWYLSLGVFLFPALSLIIPGGYSYGPLMLLFSSFLILFKGPLGRLSKFDVQIILALIGYFLSVGFINFYHKLALSSYDNPARFLFAVPVLLLLLNKKLNPWSFCFGLIFGAAAAGCASILEMAKFWSIKDNYISQIRPSGYLNPIQYGDICSVLSLLALCTQFLIKPDKNYKARLIIYFSVLLGVIGAFLSGARGGWISIPIGLLIIAVWSNFSLIKFFIFICIVFSAIIAFVIFDSHSYLNLRFISTIDDIRGLWNHDLKSTSIDARIGMWRIGWMAFLEHPFIGWGDLSSIKVHFAKDWGQLNDDNNFNHLHNDYIDALAKRGMFGFVFLILMYLAPLKIFIRGFRHKNLSARAFALMGVILITSCAIFGLTQTFLAHASGVMFFVFSLVIIWSFYSKAMVDNS